MKSPATLMVISVLVATGVPARADDKERKGQPSRLDDAPGFHGMRARWSAVMDEFDVPGMAVAVVKDGRILGIETFGARAPAKKGSPLAAPTPDTMYYLASITKTYLATAVCALADDGKLNLDDPVRKHLPRFELPRVGKGGAETITIRDLLSHRAGLIDGQPILVLDNFTGEMTEDRYYKWLALMRVKGETAYSNIHFTLLGRVVEAAGGKPWREYLHDRVLKPAGLTRTTGYASRAYADANCAVPMERVDGEWRACKVRKTDRTMHAAGGLATSVGDAARWLVLHLNDGEIDGKRVISAERAREMRTLQSKLTKSEGAIRVMEGYGLGWQTGKFHGTPLSAHGGGYPGTTTYYAILPEKKCGFAILMNAEGAAGRLMDVIAVDILDRLIEGDDRVDVFDSYRKDVGALKRGLAARAAKLQAERDKPFELNSPVRAFAGRFRNDDLGTMTVAADGKRLKVALGECELDVAPAGPDAFKVQGPTLAGAVFRFVVPKGADATSIRLAGQESVEFKR